VNYVLWIVQGLLALLFLFTGGTKLILPIEVLTARRPCRDCSCGFSAWPKCWARSA
jgi:hypothetical protein